MTRLSTFILVALPLTTGCRFAPETPESSTFEPLPETLLLKRMSLDLTGTLPSLEALEAVEEDPALLEGFRDEYLEDPRFEEQLVFLLQEHWLTAIDEYFSVGHDDYGLEDTNEYAWERAIGQEPLRLMARIIVNDEHWSESVTAHYSMGTEITSKIWPMTGYPDGDEGWHQVEYTDGRPASGVLSTNGMWWRYTSNDYNQNRSRAAAITSLLVCEDLLARPVSFENVSSILEAEDVSEMVQTDPACLACHATVEPLAAALFGFHWVTDYVIQEMERYHPEREVAGPRELGVNPAWWGEPITGLNELGWAIADDERFYRCTAEYWTSILYRRNLTLEDRGTVDDHFDAFLTGEARVKMLIRAITDSEEYRAGAFKVSEDDDIEIARTVRTMSPNQLSATIQQLTDFHWTYEGFDQLDSDQWGFRVLLGGVDGDALTRPALDPSLTAVVVLKRLAEAAAQKSAAHLGTGEGLLGEVSLDWSPEDAAFGTALEALYLQILGERADSASLAAYTEIWTTVASLTDSQTAWEATLGALFRDPLFYSY